MSPQQTIEQKMAQFDEINRLYKVNDLGLDAEILRHLRIVYREALSSMFQEGQTSALQNVGMLRQWLNEDRITEPDKMVTNEQILKMLTND